MLTQVEAIKQVQPLIGTDLVDLAREEGIQIWYDRNGEPRLNKGWAGHVLERRLGIQRNSDQAPDLSDGEVKVVPVVFRKRYDKFVAKETIALTMIEPNHVASHSFEQSHLYAKLRNVLIIAREFESREEKRSHVFSVTSFSLEDCDIFEEIKKDYELVRQTILKKGFKHLTSRMGEWVQPRTKGFGHGSKTRAFYARKALVHRMVGIPWPR